MMAILIAAGAGEHGPSTCLFAPARPLDQGSLRSDAHRSVRYRRRGGPRWSRWRSGAARPGRPVARGSAAAPTARASRHQSRVTRPCCAPTAPRPCRATRPDRVRGLIAAANEIVGKPYRWGGGHGQLADSGYDCSGAVSYALIGAHLLPTPLSSALFAGALPAGAGRWISVYGSPRTTPISRSPGCAWTRARSPTPPACRACAGDRRSASARDSRAIHPADL